MEPNEYLWTMGAATFADARTGLSPEKRAGVNASAPARAVASVRRRSNERSVIGSS